MISWLVGWFMGQGKKGVCISKKVNCGPKKSELWPPWVEWYLIALWPFTGGAMIVIQLFLQHLMKNLGITFN